MARLLLLLQTFYKCGGDDFTFPSYNLSCTQQRIQNEWRQ